MLLIFEKLVFLFVLLFVLLQLYVYFLELFLLLFDALDNYFLLDLVGFQLVQLVERFNYGGFRDFGEVLFSLPDVQNLLLH